MAVPAEVEQDHALLTGLARRHRLVDRALDRVARLRRRHDPLRLREQDRRLEDLVLRVRDRLHVPGVHERGQARGIPVVAEPAGVHRSRHEVVAQRVHRQQGRHLAGVAEVVGEPALRQRGARGRLGRQEACLRLPTQSVRHERVGQPGVVRAAPDAADDHVRLLTGELHLPLRLQPDHGLM